MAAGALAPVGVAALRSTTRREELALAALPLLFAVHQAAEGIIWLGLEGRLSTAVLDAATWIYLLFAQVVLPVLVPVALLLYEVDARRRRRLTALVALGCAVSAWLLWVITAHHVAARADGHSIVYASDAHFGYVVATAYVVATCGPPLVSSGRMLWRFGVANLAALTLAAYVKYSAVTSVWCFYAAFVSAFIMLILRAPAPRASPRTRTPGTTSG